MYKTTNSTQQSSTAQSSKGFLSFSSQSVINSSKGPSVAERIRQNSLHIASNITRFRDFSSSWLSFMAIFKLLQHYAIILMPSASNFWKSSGSSSIFITFLTLPIHICLFPGNPDFHAYLMIFFFVVFAFFAFLFLRYLLKDPNEFSLTSSDMYIICLLLGVIAPISVTFVLSDFGQLLKQYIFYGVRSTVLGIGITLGVFTSIIIIAFHFLSFLFIRSKPIIDFKIKFAPWGPRIKFFMLFELYLGLESFFEEFLRLNQKWFMFGFSCSLILIYNPIVVVYLIRKPVFQCYKDTAHFCTLSCVAMVSCIVMNLNHYISGLTPTIVFTIIIISFSLFYILFMYLLNSISGEKLKRLYSVYKQSKPVLPPTTPLVFSSPLSNQVALSQEAYAVMQSFNSLEVKDSYDFCSYLSIAAEIRIAAISNLDFVKWGLNYFSDDDTLLVCAQICQYFEDTNQIQTVLLQKIRENPNKSLFDVFLLNIIEEFHTDLISDKPQLLKMLEKKALGGMTRCRRAGVIFWGSVLNHSMSSMKESLCRLRDTIEETQSHFEELIRCYPYALSSIGIYISFLTEIKGDFIECDHYINKVSSYFIERRSDITEDEESIDGVSLLLNDQSQSFFTFTHNLSSYMDQERQSSNTTRAPIIAMWSLTIVSLLTVMICFIFIIASTLMTFNTYPVLLNMIRKCSDAVIQIASLTMASRRMCLFSKGILLQSTLPFGNQTTDASIFDTASELLPYFVKEADVLPTLLQEFYQATTYNPRMQYIIEHVTEEFIFYGENVTGSFAFALDMMANGIRNIASNIPSLYDGQELRIPFSISEIKDTKKEYMQLMRQKMRESMDSENFHVHAHEEDGLELIISKSRDLYEKLYQQEQCPIKRPLLDPVALYATTCQSTSIKHIIKNVNQLEELLEVYFTEFLSNAKSQVDSLSQILYYSEIILPIAFIIVFTIAMIVITWISQKETNFRTTLFLSLPEQVASDIFRSGGHSSKKNKSSHNDNDAEVCEIEPLTLPGQSPLQDNGSNHGVSPEISQMKEKALTIESLDQFSASHGSISGTGIRFFIYWGIIFILFASCSLFGLTYYAMSINGKFYGRSLMLSESALRFTHLKYSTLFASEFFYPRNDVLLLNDTVLYEFSSRMLEEAAVIHDILTYGNDLIPFDFREYSRIQALYIRELNPVRSNVTEDPYPSISSIHHDGYKQFGFDTQMRLYFYMLRGIIENFKNNSTAFEVNDGTWQHFHHIYFGHLMRDSQYTNVVYHEGVSEVIDQSLIVSLIIALGSLSLLIFIFIGPLVKGLNALSGYFNTTIHTISQIQPEVFARSVYIGKWLRGLISRSNYQQYEANFKRTVSASLQSRIIDESPEKVLMFTIQGQYVPTASLDTSSIENPTLPDILQLVVDLKADLSVVENVRRAMERFNEAKDTIESSVFVTKSLQGSPIRLTIRGIPTSELDVSTAASIQKFYAYVAILVRDVTKEIDDEQRYIQQRDKTISLLSKVVPFSFAKRMHDGERRISFSAGIGTVMNIRVPDYEDNFIVLGPMNFAAVLVELRSLIDNLLKQFSNVSLMSMREGVIVFIAGLFNDEQNGRTEALDTIQFAMAFNDEAGVLFEKNGLDPGFRYGVCTGGPIYCRLLMDSSPVSLVSGETSTMAAAIMNQCKSGQLLLERTTYECIYGVNIDVQIAGDVDLNGKHSTLYGMNLSQAQAIVEPL